jgi:hypothetical protein
MVIKLKVMGVEEEQSLVQRGCLPWGVVKMAWDGMVGRGLESKHLKSSRKKRNGSKPVALDEVVRLE